MRIESLSLNDSVPLANESVSEAHGIHFLSKVVGILPAIVSKIISLSLSKKITLVYSKYPALKTPLTFLGKQSQGLYLLAPLLGGLNASVSVMTHGDTLKVLCLSDEQSIRDPKVLMRLFNANLDLI